MQASYCMKRPGSRLLSEHALTLMQKRPILFSQQAATAQW